MSEAAIKRDEKGRLLPGHGLKSPGRPRRDVERRYSEIAFAAVTPGVWFKIVSNAAEAAANGDMQAARFIADVLGFKREADPFQELQVDTGDVAAPDAP